MNLGMNANNMYRRSGDGCGCGLQNGALSRTAMLDEINAVSFTVDELRLYLDTHPCDDAALEMMNEYLEKRSALMEKYAASYGALDSYGMIYGDEWVWNDPPMPWSGVEGGC